MISMTFNCKIKLINLSLESFGSEHCQRAVGLLVCQSYFPLCDQCRSGQLYVASSEQCERIHVGKCGEEWMSAKQYGFPLPNCTGLAAEVTSKRRKYQI